MLDRFRVIVRGHSAKSTATRRGAESYAELADDPSAHVEPTEVCPDCGLHRHGGEDTCPDAQGR